MIYATIINGFEWSGIDGLWSTKKKAENRAKLVNRVIKLRMDAMDIWSRQVWEDMDKKNDYSNILIDITSLEKDVELDTFIDGISCEVREYEIR